MVNKFNKIISFVMAEIKTKMSYTLFVHHQRLPTIQVTVIIDTQQVSKMLVSGSSMKQLITQEHFDAYTSSHFPYIRNHNFLLELSILPVIGIKLTLLIF
jgi:citrate lyase synthetase